MDLQHAVQALKELGFTELEAVIYAHLVTHGPSSGYAVAQQSGLARANVYAALVRLERSGMVTREETSRHTAYRAVSVAHLKHTLLTKTKNALERLDKELLEPTASAPATMARSGYEQMLAAASALIQGAQEELTIGFFPSELFALKSSLEGAKNRRIGCDFICLKCSAEACAGCPPGTRTLHPRSNSGSHWLLCVRDRQEVLAANIGTPQTHTVVTTMLPLVEAVYGLMTSSAEAAPGTSAG